MSVSSAATSMRLLACTSQLVRKHWGEPVQCRRCGLTPVLTKLAGLDRARNWIVGGLRWECWCCGQRGPKAAIRAEAKAALAKFAANPHPPTPP